MLFTWSTKNLCIVFSRWRVTGPISLLGSLVVIVLLAAGYEGTRQITRQYEVAHARRLSAFSAATVGSKLFPFFAYFCISMPYIMFYICRWTWISLTPVFCGGAAIDPGFEGNDIADEAVSGTEPEPELEPEHHAYFRNVSSRLLVGSDNRRALERRGKITMAALYAVQVFYSFFIM